MLRDCKQPLRRGKLDSRLGILHFQDTVNFCAEFSCARCKLIQRVPMGRLFDLDDIRMFTLAAQSGSLSGAAQELRVATSTVSRSLTRLERRLGLLLVRLSWFSLKWRRGVLRYCRFRPCGAGIFKA